MERMTERGVSYCKKTGCETTCPYQNGSCIDGQIYKRLRTYEDAEEQGLLVRLPCKVGDTLYAPTRNFISEFRVSRFDFGGYEKPFLWVNWYPTNGTTENFRIDGIRASKIGETVFLTREDAEAALAKEEENND